MKDIVLAKSADAPNQRVIWEIPPLAYLSLARVVGPRRLEFPLLYSLCAYDEGPEGDFMILPEHVPSFIREIDQILGLADTAHDSDLQSLLIKLREIAMEGRRQDLAVFGYAD